MCRVRAALYTFTSTCSHAPSPPLARAICPPTAPQVPFKKSFNPKDSMGNVERWLIECEAAMRDSLKDSLRRAFDAYAKTPRINWVTDWPGQVRGGRGGGEGWRGYQKRTRIDGERW